MPNTALATRQQQPSFAFNIPLDGVTPEQMASCLAAGAASAPHLIDSISAAHESGVVVTVVRDKDGQYDPTRPVYSARADHCTGELMVMAEEALEAAEIIYQRFGTRFVLDGADAAMSAAEVLIWVSKHPDGAS